MYISHEINIRESLQVDLRELYKYAAYPAKAAWYVLQNTRSMKIYVSFQFSKQEKHALYCNNVKFTQKVLIILGS